MKRPNSHQRGYTERWRRASAAFLERPGNRLCACGCGSAADMVDHRIAHCGDMRLFWDEANWQAMNRRCNSVKAVRHEGGFGRERRPYEGEQLGKRQTGLDGWPLK